MVMMMVSKGIKSEKVLNDIASMGLDPPTVEESIDNLLADKTSIGAIVKLLLTTPPEPGKPYPRARAPAAALPAATRPNLPDPSEVVSSDRLRDLLKRDRNAAS